MHHPASPLFQYVVPAAIVVIVLALRMRRMRQARRLRLETLWIVPAAYAVIAITMLATQVPQGAIAWALIAAGFAAGAAIGWQRGRSIHISVDPETHQLDLPTLRAEQCHGSDRERDDHQRSRPARPESFYDSEHDDRQRSHDNSRH